MLYLSDLQRTPPGYGFKCNQTSDPFSLLSTFCSCFVFFSCFLEFNYVILGLISVFTALVSPQRKAKLLPNQYTIKCDLQPLSRTNNRSFSSAAINKHFSFSLRASFQGFFLMTNISVSFICLSAFFFSVLVKGDGETSDYENPCVVIMGLPPFKTECQCQKVSS